VIKARREAGSTAAPDFDIRHESGAVGHFLRCCVLRKSFFAAALLAGVLSSAAEAARIDVIISKSTQKMTVMVDGEVEYVWPISTGAPGYDTPSGKFKAFRLEEDHESKEWDNAPMPHSVFFTTRGHAIHGSYSKRIGQRASHGCVRLSPSNAETFYYLVEENGLGNTHVTVKGGFFDTAFSAPSQSSRGSRLFGSRPNPVGVLRTKLVKADARLKRSPSFSELLFGRPAVKKVAPAKKVAVKKPKKKKQIVVSSN
jgi:L,D-transpeptidase catalytic domain